MKLHVHVVVGNINVKHKQKKNYNRQQNIKRFSPFIQIKKKSIFSKALQHKKTLKKK